MRVSVIVPVYNPGQHFDECVESLLGQSMPASDHELIFVDDGSTDGTGERLDALTSQHRHVRVRHIPNSGWPGRPRNVGLDMARGEFVYFVDNDDWLEPEALERLYRAAREGDADIVIGKVVAHGRWMPRGIFRRTRHGLTAEEAPFGLLTPHKLFRRELLDAHGIRFPEGRQPLEDHPLVVDAYFRARRISILADYPCYHWVARGRDTNASFAPPDPAAYYHGVRGVLDVVDERTEPGELRDRLYMRWYRGKLLGRLNGRQFNRHDTAYMQQMLDEVRALMLERFPPRLDAALSFRDQLRAQLARRGSLDGLRALGAVESALRVEARAERVRVDSQAVSLEIRATLHADDLRLLDVVRRGDRVVWRAPEPLAAGLERAEIDVTDAFATGRVQLLLVSVDGIEYEQPSRISSAPPEVSDGGVVTPRLTATASIDPATAAAGGALPAGRWKVRADVSIGGFSQLVTVRRGGDPLYLRISPTGRTSIWPSAARRMARRVPGLPAMVTRARSLRRRLQSA